MLGERFSLVDPYLVITAAWLDAVEHGGTFRLADLPAGKRCYELVAARPKCAPVLERHITGVKELLARSLPE